MLTSTVIPTYPTRSRLSDLPNVSFALAEDLMRAGIRTARDLQEIGAESAWLAIRRHSQRSHSLHSILALEGALLGVAWDKLPVGRRSELMRFAAAALSEANS